VTLEEIRATLYGAAEVTMPRFTEEMGPRERVEALEDYLNLTAVTGAQLEHARLCAHGALKALGDQWDEIQGWGMHVPSNGRSTQADITAAKAEIRPDLHAGIKEAKWLVHRLTEQLDRLSKMGDDQVASRIYSLISGT
jgi:hypothetical protein